MTGHVSALPGTGCRFFAFGRCIQEMTGDPRLHEEWRCRMVSQWEEAFDAYLDQVERFQVSQETALAIWSKRFDQMSQNRDCPDFSPGENALVGCALLHFDLCVKKLPPCPGRCKHYQQEEPS